MHSPTCHCRPCLIERHPHLAERITARIEAAKRGDKIEYRRGKPVVPKGCKNCHNAK